MRYKQTVYLEEDVLADLMQTALTEQRSLGWLLERAWRAQRGLTSPKPPPIVMPEPPPAKKPYLGRHRWVGQAHATLGRRCEICGRHRLGAPVECPGAPTDG